MLMEDLFDSTDRMKQIDREIEKLEKLKQRECDIQAKTVYASSKQIDDSAIKETINHIIQSSIVEDLSVEAIMKRVKAYCNAVQNARSHLKSVKN